MRLQRDQDDELIPTPTPRFNNCFNVDQQPCGRLCAYGLDSMEVFGFLGKIRGLSFQISALQSFHHRRPQLLPLNGDPLAFLLFFVL